MKKGFILITLLFSFLLVSTLAFAAPVTEYALVWSNHNSYDQNIWAGRVDDYGTVLYWEGTMDPGATVTSFQATLNGTATYDIYEWFGTGVWDPSNFGNRAFVRGGLGGTQNPNDYYPSNWEGTWEINIQTDMGNLTDSNIWGPGELQFMNAPTVTSIAGNVVSWTAVPDVSAYRVRLVDLADGDHLIFDSGNLAGTSFDLSGLVANDDYRLRIEARKYTHNGMVARSVYFSDITVTPVPGAIILLGSGLLGLVGLRRRQN